MATRSYQYQGRNQRGYQYNQENSQFKRSELSPVRFSTNSYSTKPNSLLNSNNSYKFSGSTGYSSKRFMHNDLPLKLSESLALRKSPARKTLSKSVMQIEENLSEFLKMLVDIESEAEKQKTENFCKIKDFNIDDVFLFFETENTQNDILSPQDLKDGLTTKLGFDLSDEDIKFLLAKFDLSCDGGISFVNLFDMLVPYDKKNRDDVESRPSTGNMSEEIVGGLKNYIDFIFDSENKLDEFRLKTLENKNFDPAKIFEEQIDVNGTGAITIQDFEKFLQGKGVIQNQREADLVFIRLDRNRDGKVSVDEFVYEFTPLKDKIN